MTRYRHSPTFATHELAAFVGGGVETVYGYEPGTDKLTSFGGSQISSYDSAGNPCNYKGSMLQWERGRRLAAYGETVFTYDAGGVRQSKTLPDGTVHTYLTEGTTVHREVIVSGGGGYENPIKARLLWYYYDQAGICAVENKGTLYHLKRNLQGDIVMILDKDGNPVAKYAYDAWGNCKAYKVNGAINTELTNDEEHIGNINPWRYRGYYWDCETGLYYLQSRYYDPAVGRFLNADSVDYADPSNLQGLNLYAYCENDPINYIDPTGHSATLALIGWGLFLLFALLAVGVVETQTQMISKGIEALADIAWEGLSFLGQAAWEGMIWLGQGIGNLWDNAVDKLGNIKFGKSKGGGRESGFSGKDKEWLDNELEKAHNAGDTALVLKILKEMKNRGLRNKRKKRGGPHMRSFWWLTIPEIIRRLFEENED